jgi:hypothetical protein
MSQNEQAKRPNGAPKTERPDSKPTARMMEAAVPKKIVGTRRETIRLKFRQDISDACVEFRYSKDNLIITSEGRPDHTFSFHFAPDDNHVRELEIAAKLIEKESQELVTIACLDIEDTGIQEESRWVKLQPGVSVKDIEIIGPSLNLIWMGFSNWYVRILLILVLAFLLMFHNWPEFRSFTSERVEPAAIFLRVRRPYQYTGSWDGINRGEWGWGKFPDAWIVGIPRKLNRIVLTVKGPEAGFSQIENKLYGFFDFVADFDLRYLENQKAAAWIIRAKNRGDYYLFTIKFPTYTVTLPTNDKGGTAILEASVYRDGRKYRELAPPRYLLTRFVKLRPGVDKIYVTVRVNGGQFENCFRVDRKSPLNGDFFSQPTNYTFSDPENVYPYGDFGFRGDGQTEMEVDRAIIEADPDKLATQEPCTPAKPQLVKALRR